MLSELPATTVRAHPERRRGIARLALLSFAMLIVSLDQYIVVVALPEIGRDLNYSAQTLQAVVSAYAVATSGFLLFGGRAADVLGRRRMLVVGLTLYAVASAVGGLATGPGLQLAARALQGLGGALVFPSTLAIINTSFTEGHERNRALSVWGGAGAAGLVIGVLLGGVLTQLFGWEAVFFVNVPLAGAAIVLAFGLIDADAKPEVKRRIDLPGALSITAAVTLLVFALVRGPEAGWATPEILIPALGGVLLLGAFVLIERRSPDPLLQAGLLANRALLLATAVAFMFTATFGTLLYWPPAWPSWYPQLWWSPALFWPDEWYLDLGFAAR
jgi:MFS family permease